jgi:hypothetical protein
MKAKMEKRLTIPTTDGGRKTKIQVLSEVLSKNTAKPGFLRNVGLIIPSGLKIRNLAAELEREKRGSAKLQDVVKNQHDQMVELTSQVQEAEKKRAGMEGTIDTLTKIIRQQS